MGRAKAEEAPEKAASTEADEVCQVIVAALGLAKAEEAPEKAASREAAREKVSFTLFPMIPRIKNKPMLQIVKGLRGIWMLVREGFKPNIVPPET